MGWFDNKESDKKKDFPWSQLTSIEQLEQAIDSSSEKPVLFFKHSSRCSISFMALSSFQNRWEGTNDQMGLYFLDLLNYRDVSNRIAELTGVMHQSPQVVVLKNREVVYTATHSGISAMEALKAIN